MREFKFRAWNKTDKTEFFDFKRLREESDTFYKRVIENGQTMQYTGLKDKHGVEIYEGDPITLYDEEFEISDTCFVLFEKGMFCVFTESEYVPLFSVLDICSAEV